MKTQNYSNHAARFPLFHFVVLPFLLIYAVRAIWICFRTATTENAWAAAFAVVVLLTALCARAMATKVQDRVIRLEMRLRLASLLPEDLRNQILSLTPQQLIALRFASDAEMPDLIRRVLANQLAGSRAIKQAITDWQADYFRV